MFKQSLHRNQRNKGFKVGHVVQLCLLIGLCGWLLYQVQQRSHHKTAMDVENPKLSGSIRGDDDDDIFNLGRKDLRFWTEEDTEVENDDNHAEDGSMEEFEVEENDGEESNNETMNMKNDDGEENESGENKTKGSEENGKEDEVAKEWDVKRAEDNENRETEQKETVDEEIVEEAVQENNIREEKGIDVSRGSGNGVDIKAHNRAINNPMEKESDDSIEISEDRVHARAYESEQAVKDNSDGGSDQNFQNVADTDDIAFADFGMEKPEDWSNALPEIHNKPQEATETTDANNDNLDSNSVSSSPENDSETTGGKEIDEQVEQLKESQTNGKTSDNSTESTEPSINKTDSFYDTLDAENKGSSPSANSDADDAEHDQVDSSIPAFPQEDTEASVDMDTGTTANTYPIAK